MRPDVATLEDHWHRGALGALVSIEDCSANQLSDRRVFRVNGGRFAKLFSLEANDRYQRERAALELVVEPRRAPLLVHAASDAVLGGCIVTERVSGTVLNAVYQTLEARDYETLVYDLGACLASLHDAAMTVPVPATELEARRRRDFAELPRVSRALELQGALSVDAARSVNDFVAAVESRLWRSPARLVHADVHNQNVFVAKMHGRWFCSLIDFEDAAPAPIELDFIHPFLNIVGECFTGRRLESAGKSIRCAFLTGYAQASGRDIDLEVLVAHALAWYLGAAVGVLEENARLGAFYLRTALGALDAATR